MTGFRSSGEWISIGDAALRFDVRRNAVHDWIKRGHLGAEESHRDGRGVHHRIHESEIVRLEGRQCRLAGCDRRAPGPSGYCCGAHKRADEMRGKPRPKLQKYPGQACEARSCEDCGAALGGTKGIVRGHLIAEGKNLVCRSCAQKRRQGDPDDGIERWEAATAAYRRGVRLELDRLREEGWLATVDVCKQVRLTRNVVTSHVRAGHLKATRHELRDGELIAAESAIPGTPCWFLFRDSAVQDLEAWLSGGDGRRRRFRDTQRKAKWARRRHGLAAEKRAYVRSVRSPGRKGLPDPIEQEACELLAEGRLGERTIAEHLTATHPEHPKPITRAQIRYVRVKRAAEIRALPAARSGRAEGPQQ